MSDRPMIFPADGVRAARHAEGGPESGPPAAEPVHSIVDSALALQLPDWDLVPPTEFVRRRPLR
jgi:hypothetical protein